MIKSKLKPQRSEVIELKEFVQTVGYPRNNSSDQPFLIDFEI